MFSKLFSVAILLASLLIGLTSSVNAQTPPIFPECSNPQGTIKVNYSSGTHGVVGDFSENRGSDIVYSLSGNDTLMQCFCGEDGQGVQTNWWKVSSLTDDEIQTLKNDGWFFVPNGALWGLDNTEYMAKNSEYACRGASSTSTAVLAASDSKGSVLGLAATGSATSIATFAGLGIASLLLGVFLRRRAH